MIERRSNHHILFGARQADSIDQVRAAMVYYDEHREEIDDILRLNREQYERGVATSRAAR